MITLHEEGVKIVTKFNINKTLTQVTNYITNVLWPDIRDNINNSLERRFTNYQLDKRFSIIESDPNEFEVGALFYLSGDTSLNPTALRNQVDAKLNALKGLIIAGVVSQGGTIKPQGFHVHYSTGSVDED